MLCRAVDFKDILTGLECYGDTFVSYRYAYSLYSHQNMHALCPSAASTDHIVAFFFHVQTAIRVLLDIIFHTCLHVLRSYLSVYDAKSIFELFRLHFFSSVFEHSFGYVNGCHFAAKPFQQRHRKISCSSAEIEDLHLRVHLGRNSCISKHVKHCSGSLLDKILRVSVIGFAVLVPCILIELSSMTVSTCIVRVVLPSCHHVWSP
mmetsp:Transcript_45223/g.72740  ORF Transcript_45223/g.72740 Transcript_45223/m.72740 type:complete len:205 (-) Transcript_45223:58-672(-)